MIVLLSSGVTLGTHVPALVLANRLRAAGVEVRTDVFERSLTQAERERLPQAKHAYRADFAVALASQRMVRDRTPALDPDAVDRLVRRWLDDDVRVLVVFSGFWVPVVERYVAVADRPIRVDICHLDSTPTASLGLFGARTEGYRHVWMFQEPPHPVPMSIPISNEPVVPWAERTKRLLAHGGGWGLGTYRARAADVIESGVSVDIVGHQLSDIDSGPRGASYYMVDPAWEAWTDDGFPPFGKVEQDRSVRYARTATHHGSFDLARERLAMMCKTGGGSLLDSLWAATPIVSLEPFGAHELVNAQLWQRLGFGVPFETWRESGFSLDLLERLHRNLLRARDGVPDYTLELAATCDPG